VRTVAVVLLLVLAGCRSPKGPGDTLDAYLKAVAAGRNSEAYALLSTDYKRGHDQATFERGLSDKERKAAGEKLRGAQVTLKAEVTLPDGDLLPLVLEDGTWRFARDPLDFYPQRAPAEALRSFIRAVEHSRWEVVLRFVPTRSRPGVTADRLRERWAGEKRDEIRAQLDAARAHLSEPFILTGDEARLPLSERKQVKLVREDGVWKLESLE
jgi:hypothetical protein